MSVEIHGREGCPFAWRARLAAAEKGVAFRYVAFDTDPPDAGFERNPDKKSPLLVDGDFVTPESGVIAWYLDEAYPGPALAPAGARERSHLRLVLGQLEGLTADTRPGAVLSPEGRARVDAAIGVLARELGAADFLGGAAPSLVDVMIWPMLAGLVVKLKLPLPEGPVQAYWERVSSRATYRATAPAWAA